MEKKNLVNFLKQRKGNFSIHGPIGIALGIVGAVVGVVLLVKAAVAVYPLFNNTINEWAASGMLFGTLAQSIAPLLYGILVLVAVIAVLLAGFAATGGFSHKRKY